MNSELDGPSLALGGDRYIGNQERDIQISCRRAPAGLPCRRPIKAEQKNGGSIVTTSRPLEIALPPQQLRLGHLAVMPGYKVPLICCVSSLHDVVVGAAPSILSGKNLPREKGRPISPNRPHRDTGDAKILGSIELLFDTTRSRTAGDMRI